jgi:hypothetical protein
VMDGPSTTQPPVAKSIGIRQEVVDAYTSVQKAGTGKYALYGNDGSAVKEIRGLYGLTLLDAAARDIGADTKEADSKMGRGFRASCLTSAILKHLKA